LNQAAAAARDGKPDEARTALQTVPAGADADFFNGGGRIALVARDPALARTLFIKALEIDPSSYRAALGIASTFLLERDFDSSSRTFDAARNRTHDKDEIKFLTVAIGDLATIRFR
jgi:Flp pilus assembly protein TadD